jgi:hypothetical protein
MGPFDAYVDRLDGIRKEIEQADPVQGPDPEVVKRLTATVEEMKTAGTQAMEAQRKEMLAQAAQMRAQAEKMRQEQKAEDARARGEGPPNEYPQPWEDHQGLSDNAVQQVVAQLLEAALPRPS